MIKSGVSKMYSAISCPLFDVCTQLSIKLSSLCSFSLNFPIKYDFRYVLLKKGCDISADWVLNFVISRFPLCVFRFMWRFYFLYSFILICLSFKRLACTDALPWVVWCIQLQTSHNFDFCVICLDVKDKYDDDWGTNWF